MAYVFKEGKMASNILDTALTNAVFYDSESKAAAVKDGSLVVLGALESDTTYSASGLEYDTYKAAAPAAVTDEVVIVDYAGISEGEIMGNKYRIGNKLYDLEVPAGVATRVRRLHLHDKFWLGASNFVSAPTAGKFAIATANSCKHTAKDDLNNHTGYAIKVLVENDLTVGNKTEGKLYLCEVVQL